MAGAAAAAACARMADVGITHRVRVRSLRVEPAAPHAVAGLLPHTRKLLATRRRGHIVGRANERRGGFAATVLRPPPASPAVMRLTLTADLREREGEGEGKRASEGERALLFKVLFGAGVLWSSRVTT